MDDATDLPHSATEDRAVAGTGLGVDVVEINAYWPRPFVFTETALCLRDALRLAGHDSQHRANEADPERAAIVIVPTDGWREAIARLDPSRVVLFNMEQLGSDAPWTRDGYVPELQRWTVADYNSANVEYLRRENGPAQRVFEIPIVPGPSVEFRPDLQPERTVDVLFYGSPNPRRDRVIEQLRAAGLTVETVAGAFGWELTPAVLRARIVLHVHFYETRLFPVARMLQPVAGGVPVVCETSVCSQLSDWRQSGIVFADYDDLVDACRALLDDPERQLVSAQRSLRFARLLDVATPMQALLQTLAA
jgi:hypothetical protein